MAQLIVLLATLFVAFFFGSLLTASVALPFVLGVHCIVVGVRGLLA